MRIFVIELEWHYGNGNFRHGRKATYAAPSMYDAVCLTRRLIAESKMQSPVRLSIMEKLNGSADTILG